MNNLLRLLLDRRSTAALSFALNSFAFMLFLMALISLGYLGLVFGGMTYATQAAARSAAVQTGVTLSTSTSTTPGCTDITSLTSYLPGLLPPNINVTTSWSNNSGSSSTAAGTSLNVTSTYLWTPPVGLLRVKIPLSVSATAMVEGTSGTVKTTCS